MPTELRSGTERPQMLDGEDGDVQWQVLTMLQHLRQELRTTWTRQLFDLVQTEMGRRGGGADLPRSTQFQDQRRVGK